jgi:hypothetical protein
MGYVTNWEEICKVVGGEKVKVFKNILEQIQVVLSLEGTDDVDAEDIFPYFIQPNYCDYEDELADIDDKVFDLQEVFNEIIADFNKETNILVFLDLIRIDDFSDITDFENHERTVFRLSMEDMVQLTPKAKKLEKNGIYFDLEAWVDDNF